MTSGLDRPNRNADLTMPESSSRRGSSDSEESTYSKSEERGSRSGKSGQKFSLWGGGSSSSSKKKKDNAPQMPSRMVSPMPQPRTIGRKPRRRGSLGGTPPKSTTVSTTVEEEAVASAEFRQTKRIVEEATVIVASGPSQDDMDKYGYGYAAPDEAGPVQVENTSKKSGRTPRRSSMKSSSKKSSSSSSSSPPFQEEMDKYGYGYGAPDNHTGTTSDDDLAPSSGRRLVVGAGRAPRRSSLKCSKSDHGLNLYGQKQRRSSLGFSDDGSSDGSFAFEEGTDGGTKPSSRRRGSITFADYDFVQEVEPVKNLTSSHGDLWYNPEEIREINQHNRYMVDVAKSGEIKDRKLCIRGLESFLVPSRERKARQNKIWDSIMMIQDHQWENGVVDEEIMSRVLSQLSRDDTEIAATRAVQDATDTMKYLAKGSKKSSSSSSRRDRPRRRQSLGY